MLSTNLGPEPAMGSGGRARRGSLGGSGLEVRPEDDPGLPQGRGGREAGGRGPRGWRSRQRKVGVRSLWGRQPLVLVKL